MITFAVVALTLLQCAPRVMCCSKAGGSFILEQREDVS